jgi:hypothetical protein
MTSVRVQNAPQIDGSLAVQVQFVNRSASGGRNPDNHLEIIAPPKMSIPLILAWMKKWHAFPSFGINGMRMGELMIVTELAGISKIVKGIRAAECSRNNMLDGKFTVEKSWEMRQYSQ